MLPDFEWFSVAKWQKDDLHWSSHGKEKSRAEQKISTQVWKDSQHQNQSHEMFDCRPCKYFKVSINPLRKFW
ncbi:MAG: hypothetical protein D6816_08670 [Bacteroidetes bacterium]|nr:MAG: hypothetical protein D6816_08670 [Bacteroidota bacterium]